MAEEGVFEATWTEAKAHPYVIGGAVVLLVLALWYFGTSKSAGSTPQQFAFSYGPSDAQVQAGTALQIAQQADATQLAAANIAAGLQTTGTNDYFNYLTQANNNATNLQQQSTFENAETASSLGTLSAQTQIQINAQNNSAALAALQSTGMPLSG